MDFQALVAAFGMLFIMEIGDKTQLAVLSLSANTGRPRNVFLGAALALSLVTALGVALGTGASKLVPGDWLSRTAALAFILVGAFMLWKARPGTGKPDSDGEVNGPGHSGLSRGAFGVISASFALLFLAEMGDKTQLAVISLTAKTGSALSVLVGAVSALVLLTLLGAMAGKALLRLVPLLWVSRLAGAMFIASGVLSLAGVF